MAAIRVISNTTIQARSQVNNGDSPEQIELNPWDLRFLLLEGGQKGLLFHKPTMPLPLVIQHLKETFSSTLDFFVPLAGRLAVVPHGGDDGTSSVFVSCNNAGASFVHAIAENTTIDDILEPTYVPPIVESFFPLGKSKNFEGTHVPLMAVQVTELVDGIFIAFSVNHCVSEAKPALDFMNTWAQISRNGLNPIESNLKLASFERWFPHGNIERPIRIPLRDIMEKYADEYASSLHPPPISKRIFHFKRENITELKAKANSEVEDGILSNKISSLQAVISHVWRYAIKNLRLDPEEEVHYSILITARPRISNPPIPDNYFGNTVQFATVTMKVRDLVGVGGLGKFALEMNKVISSYTEEKIKSDFEALIPNPTISLQSGNFGKVMHTGGSQRSNFYTIDFGWGRPLALRRGPAFMYDWDLVVDAGAEEDSFDIELCISYEILELMGRDPEFMHAVSSPPPPPPPPPPPLPTGRL
ncbi:protein ENHANCED PSEUDOMONAS SUSCEPTIBILTY 1-like [Neltuma alba]|uniref:protein ENHANCED PSEUDOMONAS SUSCEPTIBILTY 1-like n=1 Tax=Neltuma alba TaxID=207710 RepID=UPI0010A39420|nr:protein ENHANCED PSEUDOMONAS SUSCEPTIBILTY 1-like [Prosopis alba]XP_028803473.1 protein ENHANCED PSEUDOMONAS SUSCEPTIBILTY 1-like [Prosopis alba]